MGGLTTEEMDESADGAIVREIQKIKEDVLPNKATVNAMNEVNIESKLNDIYSYVYHIHNRLTRMETKLTAFLKGEKIIDKSVPKLPEAPKVDIPFRQVKEDDYWKSTN